MILTGRPFAGEDRRRLKEFLGRMGLSYDEGIEYSVCVLNQAYEIIGTGSADRNVLKCIAVHPEYQGEGIAAEILSELIQYEVEQNRPHIFIYTKPENEDLFCSMGFYEILKTPEVLFLENKKKGFQAFLEDLRRETVPEALEAGEREGAVGAAVANCNPFTLGHRYLLEKALESCQYLHLFLLSDDRSMFTPKERHLMVQEGIEGLPRVILHWTSDYMVSAATFPTYFFKDKQQGQKANCRLDLELFGKRIAPALGITRRFVGTEPYCAVTNQYNQEMKRVLPSYGIQVREIERKRLGEEAVSASKARAYLEQCDWEHLRALVPEGVFRYVSRKKMSEKL